MANKLVATGTIAIQDELTSDVKDSFDLAKRVPELTGLTKKSDNSIIINSGSGVVPLSTGGASPIKGILVFVSGGKVTLKHNTNTNGAVISSVFFLIGEISTMTVETTEAGDVAVDYIVFG